MTILYIPIIPQWKGLNSSGDQVSEQGAVAPSKVGKPNNNHVGVKNIKKEPAGRNYYPIDSTQIAAMSIERTICTMVRAGPI